MACRLLGLAMSGAVVTAPAISFENLTLAYDQHPVVHHVTGTISQGALLAIVGSNGAGKSTLLKALVGELKPVTGKIDLHGASKLDQRCYFFIENAYRPFKGVGRFLKFPISV